jgi:hypothetical protein
MTIYLGCHKCIEEKRPDAAKIEATGQIKIMMGMGCSMTCIHHGTNLEFIEDKHFLVAGK